MSGMTLCDSGRGVGIRMVMDISAPVTRAAGISFQFTGAFPRISSPLAPPIGVSRLSGSRAETRVKQKQEADAGASGQCEVDWAPVVNPDPAATLAASGRSTAVRRFRRQRLTASATNTRRGQRLQLELRHQRRRSPRGSGRITP